MRKPLPLVHDEAVDIINARWVAMVMQTVGFISEKMEMQDLMEFNKKMAQGLAMMIMSAPVFGKGVEGPVKFALITSIIDKNCHGSDIIIPEDEMDNTVMDVRECGYVRAVRALAAKGLPLDRDQYCFGCIGLRSVAADLLGLEFECETNEAGCMQTIRMKQKS